MKWKKPAGKMPVQLVASTCPMAVLVEMHCSPEVHRKELTIDSSFY